MTTSKHEFAIKYLEAKKPIDDRSLNRHVWDELWRSLPEPPLRILELGAGIGTMIERLVEQDKLSEAAYTAVDLDQALLESGRNRLQSLVESRGLELQEHDSGQAIKGVDLDLVIDFIRADITAEIHEQVGDGWDLLIGNALLDLVDIPAILPDLLRLIQPEGMYYFTITFDGLTHFSPALDQELDRSILRHYHQTMDERCHHGRAAGNSQSGRILLAELHRLGAKIGAAGSSDWIVHPKDGAYSSQERQFLGFILDTIENALQDRHGLKPEDLQSWLEQRRRQLSEGNLIYLAHQLDVCGHPPAQADP